MRFSFFFIIPIISSFNFPKIRLNKHENSPPPCIESEEQCFAEIVYAYDELIKNYKTNMTNNITNDNLEKYNNCILNGNDGCSIILYL